MSKPYIYPAARPSAPFYARRKSFRMLDGETVTATLTPLTSGTFLKPCKGPRGGRAYKTCYRQLWDINGVICSAAKQEFAPNDYGYTLKPYTGGAYDRYDTDAAPVTFANGIYAGLAS